MSLKVLYDYYHLEKKVLKMSQTITRKELCLEDTCKLLKMIENREKSLSAEKVGLSNTVKFLEDTVEENKSNLEENHKLKAELKEVKEKNENTLKLKEKEFQRLLKHLNDEETRHKAELLTVKQQCRRELENTRKDWILSANTKQQLNDALMGEKDEEVKDLKNKLKIQEAEAHNKVFNLEMEYRGKIARIQEVSRQSPQNLQPEQRQPSVPCLIPHNIYKRKLDVLQEEKDKEIKALLEKVKELEKMSQLTSFAHGQVKKRKM